MQVKTTEKITLVKAKIIRTIEIIVWTQLIVLSELDFKLAVDLMRDTFTRIITAAMILMMNGII